MEGYNQYISDVLNDKIVAGNLIKKAVLRFEYMRSNGDKHGFYFDPAAVSRVIRFFQNLRHTSGDFGGKKFIPLPWQEFVLAGIYGFKHKDTGKRVCTKAYVEVARKNGKSEFAGALGLYMAFMDGENGAEVYSAANAYDQASICWGAGAVMAARLRKDSASFSKNVRVYNSSNNKLITSLENPGSFFKPVAVTKTLDGLRPHCAIIDEFHEAPTDDVLRVMESGVTNRSQPLILVITTAGFNVNGPCYQYRKTAVSILEGQKENWNTFAAIHTIDDGDNWQDENTWAKPNPSMPATPTLRGMRDAYQKAVTEGASAEVNFRTKNLNQWLTTKTRWLSDDIWMRNAHPVNADANLQWWAGLDLSTTRDLTALVFFSSKDEHGRHNVIPFFFIPEENAKERSRRDGVPYLDWARDGFVIMTPGDAVDYDYVLDITIQKCKHFGVNLLLYDPCNATQMAINLETEGIKTEKFAQTTRYFHEPIKYMEVCSSKGEFAHGGNPVLRWMAQNVQMYIDTNGNQKFDKRGSEINRIDGLVAEAMAVAGYLNSQFVTPLPYGEGEGLMIF